MGPWGGGNGWGPRVVGLAGALGCWDWLGTEGGGIGWGPGVVGLAGALGWWDWLGP